jgi:hypothetical protein
MRMRLLAAVCLVGMVGICSPGWAAKETRFRLTVLMQDWHGLERAQTWEEAWPRLKRASGTPFFTIDEHDVAAYGWQAQRIILRPEVNQRVLEAARKLPEIPERVRKLKALWATEDLMAAVAYRGFVVSLDGEPLYGGVFLRKESQLSMGYPVIHSAMDEHRRIVLRLSPIQFPFGSLWDDGSGDALESLDNPTVRELREVFPDVKERMGEDERKRIESFKRLIQDPRILAVFTALKTPAQASPVPRAERPAPARPARIVVTPSSRDPNEGWSLSFWWPDSVSEVRWRLVEDSRDGGWSVVQDRGEADLGELSPGRHKIDIEAFDWAGEMAGRYTFWLDPEREFLFYKKFLVEEGNPWVHFYDGEKGDWSGLYFNALQYPEDALSEIRYSLDGCSLDRRFPVSFKDGDGKEKLYEPVPPETAFACVQLVYRDGEVSEVQRFPHHDAEPAPSEPAAASPVPAAELQPVSLRILGYGPGWTLYFRLEEDFSARAIRYRFGNDPEWRSTRPDIHIDLITGERFPRGTVRLNPGEVKLGRHRLEVKLTDWSGVESVPYVLWFDPEAAELVKKGKEDLLAADSKWAVFDDEYDLLRFGALHNSQEALREVRYSFDGCALDKRLAFRPWSRLGDKRSDINDFFIRGVKDVSSVCGQIVFRDGEVTEPRQYFRKPAG